jgi:site-specific recombinase XerD
MKIYVEKFTQELDLRGVSYNTKKTYLKVLKCFLQFISKPPEELDSNDIKNYQYNLLKVKKLNPKTINQHTSGILFFYQKVLNKYYHPQMLTRMKEQKIIPTILTKDEIKKMLAVTSDLKYKSILMTMYSAGLRVSEVINLKVTDIDSKRMVIIVRNGKGGNDRQAILSPILLECLRRYWITRKKNPSLWLFPSLIDPFSEIPPRICGSGINRLVKRVAKRANVKKNVSCHTLRHSFAVHLLESGTDIRYIQFLLGHKNITTTAHYTYIANIHAMKVTSPLDEILKGGK